jgi:hypothetical protein
MSAVRKISDASWGADLDFKRRPGIPREKNHENGSSGRRAHWVEPVLQISKITVNKTVERPHITPVFGTCNPPRWLSGAIRNYAYKFSEDKLRHWMLLLLADRVDMVEVFLADLFNGKMPEIFGKMELRTITRARQMRAHRRRKSRP